MARTFAIANHKGGVGKTTTAVNLGAGLAARGYRVLLVDMDAQANLTDTLRATDATPNMYDILTDGVDAAPVEVTPQLHVLPSSLDLAAAENELQTTIGRERLLTDALQPLLPRYDFVIIDTAPTLGQLTINAMAAAEAVILPLQAEYYALKGMRGLLGVIESVQRRVNRGLYIGGVIITQYDTRTTLHKQVRETIVQQFGAAVFSTSVRKCIALAEAQAKRHDIFTYAPDSAGARDYAAVVDEFIQRYATK